MTWRHTRIYVVLVHGACYIILYSNFKNKWRLTHDHVVICTWLAGIAWGYNRICMQCMHRTNFFKNLIIHVDKTKEIHVSYVIKPRSLLFINFLLVSNKVNFQSCFANKLIVKMARFWSLSKNSLHVQHCSSCFKHYYNLTAYYS